ncbi:MAG: transcriptional repressor [Negativicutes bacterium]|nr:transcriptional repressor [Negativicutes bacterium]
MLDEIKAKLKEKGFRLTPQRQAIISLVINPGPKLTAAEIWGLLRPKHPDMSLDTVYRNLTLLTELGVLIPIAGAGKDGTRYEPVTHSRHHHHIVCLKCGEAACIDTCPINPQFLATVQNQGYQLLRHNLELFGLCARCKPEDRCYV